MSGKLYGTANGNAKLSERAIEIMRRIAQARGRRFKARRLALAFGVHAKTVNRIVRGKRRQHSPGPIDRPAEYLPDGTARRDTVRCPVCGALVYPPCIGCAVRHGTLGTTLGRSTACQPKAGP